MTTIKLKSSDDEIFSVPYDVAKCSVTIKTMIDDLGLEENDGEAIPLLNVNSTILRKTIEWMTHHKDDPPVEDEDRDKRILPISSWDAQFFSVDQSTLFELMLAANYLDIKSLLDVGCDTVADMIRDRSPDEIRQTFNITNDLTPEEVQEILGDQV